MSRKLAEVNEIYSKAASFFGEDAKKVAPEQFFTIVTSFIENFKVNNLSYDLLI
jgi:hypothetical protein